MIACDFEYYAPSSIAEALGTYQTMLGKGKSPVYYAGGTEIITMARAGRLRTGAVIDIKGIPECGVFSFVGGQLVIGAAVTAGQACEANAFPLLSAVARRIADHTCRNRITIGGGVCGSLPYREMALPFLLGDGIAVVAGPGGTRLEPLHRLLTGGATLSPGDLLVQLITDESVLSLPHYAVRRVRNSGDSVGYPLVSVAAVKRPDGVKVAISGLCTFAFRSDEIDRCLADTGTPLATRVEHAVSLVPGPVVTDLTGSSVYRKYVFKQVLSDIMTELEEVGA
ncbi:MAG: Carbon monoxide dehydrogenase medium chain [Firmicutes bacterium ADurb.Bin506]|nr:MAG: Carbon monoxide dehydrogenase medium chain [Firmicutes bacterium ADurb.Bin506]